ncbi:hypothetical protein GCM10010452_72350 [Crossiella cryophila]
MFIAELLLGLIMHGAAEVLVLPRKIEDLFTLTGVLVLTGTGAARTAQLEDRLGAVLLAGPYVTRSPAWP